MRVLHRQEDPMAISRTQPKYELRARRHGAGDTELEIWQMPSPATPQVTTPARVAGLRGRNLELVEHRVLKKLKEVGIRIDILPIEGMGSRIAEDTALNLALLFRTLAPMRSRDAMRLVSEGIDQMSREEAAYWLGMAVHRKNPRRVLTALRVLMTDPKRK
jgi:hypothetical protein